MNTRVAWMGIALLAFGSGARASWNCPLDFNHDCFVTGEDFDAYVESFELGNDSADYNGDGFVTGEDFDAFVADFQLGCPRDDFNSDGGVDCRDLNAFQSAFLAGDPSADLNCDGLVNVDDQSIFLAAYPLELLDRNRNGIVDCDDLCVFVRQLESGSMAADYTCDGTLDINDFNAYLTDFNASYTGRPCPKCAP